MFTTARMAYQHNRTGSRALCFEMKSNKSLKTSKIYKISKNSKVSKRWLDLQVLQGNSGLCFEMKSKQKSKNSQNIQNIQKLQNIQNSKIYDEHKVQERWLDLQALQGSEAPRSLQPATASKIKQNPTKQSKVELKKQNKL